MKNVLFVALIGVLSLFTACGSSGGSNEPEKELKEMTASQEKVFELLTKVITKRGLTHFSSDEVISLTEQMAEYAAYEPEKLLPMLSYYEFYDKELGLHTDSALTDLTFYMDVEALEDKFFNSTYPFCAFDKSNRLSWRLTAVLEDGVLKTDKIGGIVYVHSLALTCVDGLAMKFYLEDKSTVLVNVTDEYSCKLSGGLGAALTEFDLERLAKADLKAVEVFDVGEGQSVVIPIDNPYMKRYFKGIKAAFNADVIK